MDSTTDISAQTRQCPFCAETIQPQAIKCRFCGEFLNTDKARALHADPAQPGESEQDEEISENILFAARPSLLAMAGATIRGLLFLGLAAFLIFYPLEEMQIFQPTESSVSVESDKFVDELPAVEPAESSAEQPFRFGLTEGQALMLAQYRVIAGLGLGIVVLLVLLMKMIKLKMTYYEVTANRIEWSRGILDRRVDNLDMFRVVDLRLRRSLLDCILGIGTVALITTDKTDPEFNFEKLRNSRGLYDIIKKTSLDADRRSGVIHLE